MRQRESHLRAHILPRSGHEAPHTVNVEALQQFATDLRKVLSRKSVVQILVTVFGILAYAEKCGTLVVKVSLKDLQLGSSTDRKETAYFTIEQATNIIATAKEPYRTLFAIAWNTGLRAGEILALTVADLDFQRKTIRVDKTADDNTREIRQPKTKSSVALLPMPSALETMLRNYLKHLWKSNAGGFLFPNPKGTRPKLRDNVVKYGLKRVLKRLGIPANDVGLHGFRHGLATELAESAVPLPVLQQQMRHADVRTTLRIYAHAIPSSQRDAIEQLASRSISTVVPISTDSRVN